MYQHPISFYGGLGDRRIYPGKYNGICSKISPIERLNVPPEWSKDLQSSQPGDRVIRSFEYIRIATNNVAIVKTSVWAMIQ